MHIGEQDLCAIAARLVEVVEKRYFEAMSPKERSELQAAIAQKLGEILESMREEIGEEPGISY